MPRTAAHTVWVVGSLNVDLVLRVTRIAGPGETVLATGSSRGCGGKGANQAVAAARAGAPTRMVGCIGADGEPLLEHLVAAGVTTEGVARSGSASGLAVVTVDAAGANTITVVPGANARCTPVLVETALAELAAGDVVVAQAEIPLDAVAAAGRRVRASGATFVLNLAPSTSVDHALLDQVDVLVVNEHEATDVLASLAAPAAPVAPAAPETPQEVATELAGRLGTTVVVTLGAAGAAVATPGSDGWLTPAIPALTVVDTTGAGDAFVGALAAALASGLELAEAVRWGTAAGSIAVSAPGAQGAPAPPEAITRLLGATRLSTQEA